MNPIGLTRAEAEKEQEPAPAKPQDPAPAGTVACIATVAPDGKRCGAEAKWLITWADSDAKMPKSPMCTECAKRFRALAQSHNSSIGIESITQQETVQMGTKNNPGKYDCYGKAEPDEPIFILRANDPIAPMVVRLWAAQYWQQGGKKEKVDDARAVADAMEAWHKKRHMAPAEPTGTQ